MRTITQREMRNDSSEILREVEAGSVVVVTRRGTPIARLEPYGGARRALKPARQPAVFQIEDLVDSHITTSEVLEEMRGQR